MKTKLIIGLLLAVIISEVFLVNHRYKSHLESWNKVACETFEEALWKDLESRRELKIKHYGKDALTTAESKNPKSVFVTSKYGRREYKIDSCKHINNVTSDSRMRKLYSIVLEEYPVIPDTLNAIWRDCLNKKNIMARTGIRVSVTDLDNQNEFKFSKLWKFDVLKDSLLSRYAGYRCEVEVTGCANYTWLSNMDIKDYFWFSIPLLMAALLYIVGTVFKDKIKKHFTKEVAVEVPVIIEKKIPVIAIEKSQTHIYRLTDEILFDADASSLKKKDASVHLSPQAKTLLKAFLDAKNHRLTTNEIMSVLWPKGNGGLYNIYQSTARLRNQLATVPEITLINDDCVYQLKIADSIEE